MTRAERNHNPLNIRKTKDKFLGEANVQEDPEFKKFINNIYGYRAALVIIIKTYKNKHGIKTIKGIINRWAPPEENDTKKYIKFVSYRSGILPDEELKTEDYPLIIEAMAKMEGVKTPNRTEIIKALKMLTESCTWE